MAPVTLLEDLVAWQKARVLAQETHIVSRAGGFARDYDHRGQTRPAALSVVANFAEGFERSRTTKFIRYLAISGGSAADVLSQMFAAHDVGFVDAESLDCVRGRVDEASRGLRGPGHSVERRASQGRYSALGTQHAAQESQSSDLGPRTS
jgi:four helix bundle protein